MNSLWVRFLIESSRNNFNSYFDSDRDMKKINPLNGYSAFLLCSVLVASSLFPSLSLAQQAATQNDQGFETTMAIGPNEFLDPAAQPAQQSGQGVPPQGQPITPLPVVAVDPSQGQPPQVPPLPSATIQPVTPPVVTTQPQISKVPAIEPPSLTGTPNVAPVSGAPLPPTAQSGQIISDVPPVMPESSPVPSQGQEGSNVGLPPAAPSSPEAQLPPPVEVPPSSALGPDQGIAQGGIVDGQSGSQMEQHSGQYYDSLALVPDSELANSGISSIRKVDPKFEPGQRFVVVEKGASEGSYEAQYVSATRALKLGRYAAAMEMFQVLHSKNRRDVRVLMGLAIAQQGAGFLQSAIETYENVLKIQPNNASAIINLMGLMKDQFPSVTLQRLSELRRKYPNNPGVPAQMGHVNAELKQYDQAMRFFEVAASMEPRNPDHIYNMAIISDRKGEVSNAIKLYERSLELDASFGNGGKSLPREQIYDRLVVLRRKI